MKATVDKKDVVRAYKNLDLLAREVSHFASLAGKKAGEEYAGLVRSGIGTKATPMFVNTPWEPLSEQWKKAKIAHQDEFWIETGEIYRSVRTKFVYKFLQYIEVFAGLMQKDDPDAFQRAMKNEYGFGLGPARPLFRPAIELFTKKAGDYRKIKRSTLIWREFQLVVSKAIRKVYR